MYKIAIRADGGPAVGMGHIMRCLALAEELKDLGCSIFFLSRYDQGIDKITAMGFKVLKLKIMTELDVHRISDADYNYGSADELEEDLQATGDIIQQLRCDLLLVDKYNLSAEYFYKLRKYILKIAYIDDLNLFCCSADIIINGNINATALGYKQVFKEQKLLLGTRYTMLRKEFRNISDRKVHRFDINNPSEIPEIMITTGGADPYNCTGRLLQIMLHNSIASHFKYNIVLGSGFIYKKQIEDVAEKYSNITLYTDYPYLSKVMLMSDLAISSGGSTLYELCCCGTPTLAFIMADNQKGIVETMDDNGYIRSIGWYSELEESNIEKIVFESITSYETRKTYSEKMQKLVDGSGVSRIAQEIVNKVN